MNQKKAKRKRKENKFHPADKRILRRVKHSNNAITFYSIGARRNYQLSKKEK